MREKINTNALRYEKLLAEFASLGFKNPRAVARLVAEVTGTSYANAYRALLYFKDMGSYLELLEDTLQSVKHE